MGRTVRAKHALMPPGRAAMGKDIEGSSTYLVERGLPSGGIAERILIQAVAISRWSSPHFNGLGSQVTLVYRATTSCAVSR